MANKPIPPEDKRTFFTIYANPAEKEKINIEAQIRGISRSALCKIALTEYLTHHPVTPLATRQA